MLAMERAELLWGHDGRRVKQWEGSCIDECWKVAGSQVAVSDPTLNHQAGFGCALLGLRILRVSAQVFVLIDFVQLKVRKTRNPLTLFFLCAMIDVF